MNRALTLAVVIVAHLTPAGLQASEESAVRLGRRDSDSGPPSCRRGAIPVCIPRWEWDCIEGTEVVPNHCDIYSRGCSIEE